MNRIFFLSILILLFHEVKSQTALRYPAEDIASIIDIRALEENTFIFIDSNSDVKLNAITLQKFVPVSSINKWKFIPSRLVTKPVYLKFSLTNSSANKKSIYYYPGGLYDELKVYQTVANGPINEIEDASLEFGFLKLSVEPGTMVTFIVKGKFCRSTLNDIESKLLSTDFMPYYKVNTDKVLINKKVIGILFSGALITMILFTIVNFYLNRKSEFVYFGLYSFCMFFLIFFTAYLARDAGRFKGFFVGYLDFLLLMTGTIFYLSFTRIFLNTKVVHPKLDKFFLIEQWMIVLFLGLYSFLHFGTNDFVTENLLENIMKILTMIAAVIFVVIAAVKRDRLINYIAFGTLVQILFYAISLFLIYSKSVSDGALRSPIFYFEAGVVVSVIFFLLGLTYKNKTELIGKIKEQEAMKLEVEKKGFETQLAVLNAQQDERNRISADMHDDLGAGMTAIRLYSELARGRIGEMIIPEIDKISNSANELLVKMNAIIWSMSSSNDTLGNMVAYIRTYAIEYLEEMNIELSISVPENLPDIVVPGAVRREVFLVVKEALHNIVKHARASEVKLTLTKTGDLLKFTIRDDGKGINLENLRVFGNGVKNMKKRMDAVNVSFNIENDKGTTVTLTKML